jgi:cytosine/adenosine deaminase-related metal-dependent hydrolase
MLRRGIPVALGVDSNGLNDDHDMLQEMRVVSLLHRESGHASVTPAASDVVQMATEHGAAACRFAEIGTLDVGQRADVVLIDLDRMVAPGEVPGEDGLLDLVLQRARPAHVDAVIVDGDVVLSGGRPTRFDEAALEVEIQGRLAQPLSPAEKERQGIVRSLRPFIRSFYSRWL